MEQDNRSEEYKLLISQVYNDFISLGSLEKTAKKHGIPVNLAWQLLHKSIKFSIPPEKLKEDYIKSGSSNAIAKYYGVSPATVSQAFKRHGISISELRREISLSKEDMRKIGVLRAEEIYKDYVFLGTLRKVAQKHGLTPERIRQILKAGDNKGLFKYEADKYAANKERFSSLAAPNKLKEDFILHGSMKAIARYYNVPETVVSQFMRKFNVSHKELRRERGRIKTHKDYEKLVKELEHHPTATELMRGSKAIPGLHNRILFYYGSLDNFRRTFGYPPPEKWYVKRVERIKHRSEASRKNILECVRIKPNITIAEIVDTLGIVKEAVRLHLLNLEKDGTIGKVINRGRHYYYLKNPEAISYDNKNLKLSDIKAPLSLEDKSFIEKISFLYIKFGDFSAAAKKMSMHKTFLIEQLDRILESHALAPIHNRREFVLALRIKRIYDQVHNSIRTAKYFGVADEVIDKYLKYGNTASLFKRSEISDKHRDPRAVPKKEDPASKKNIALIKKIKEEYDRFGSHKKIAQLHGVSWETIRHMLIMGNDLGLFEYPQKKLYARITREQLYNDFLRYKSLYKLCKHYHTESYQVKEAMDKHGLSLSAINFEIHRHGILKSYRDLVERLSHHPSTPEIKRESPYLIHGIKKWWGSIFTFRKAYGFPNPKMGAPLS